MPFTPTSSTRSEIVSSAERILDGKSTHATNIPSGRTPTIRAAKHVRLHAGNHVHLHVGNQVRLRVEITSIFTWRSRPSPHGESRPSPRRRSHLSPADEQPPASRSRARSDEHAAGVAGRARGWHLAHAPAPADRAPEPREGRSRARGDEHDAGAVVEREMVPSRARRRLTRVTPAWRLTHGAG